MNRSQGPKVSFVIPTRDAKQTNVQRRISNLRELGTGFNVVMVGTMTSSKQFNEPVSDKTWDGFSESDWRWAGINPQTAEWQWVPNPKAYSEYAKNIRYIIGTRMTILEVEMDRIFVKGHWVKWQGRNSNVLRKIGCLFSDADVFVMSDMKITNPKTYIPKALRLLREKQVGAVAGEVVGRFDDPPHWIDIFGAPGGSVFRRFPTFGGSFYLDASNMGKMRTLPVLSNWVMDRSAFEQMGGYDENARISYEDFMSVQKFVDAGGRFWICNDDDFKVVHTTRKSFKDLILEWKRSGGGAADMLHFYPHSVFAQNRYNGVVKVAGASLVGITILAALIVSGLLTGNWETLKLLGIFAFLGYSGAGAVNAWTAKRWYGFFFPIVTGYVLLRFSYSFLRQHIRRDGASRLLQTMWGYLTVALALALMQLVIGSFK